MVDTNGDEDACGVIFATVEFGLLIGLSSGHKVGSFCSASSQMLFGHSAGFIFRSVLEGVVIACGVLIWAIGEAKISFSFFLVLGPTNP